MLKHSFYSVIHIKHHQGKCTDIAMNHTILYFQSLVDLAPKYILEQFMEAELMVNITEHEVSFHSFQLASFKTNCELTLRTIQFLTDFVKMPC